MNEAQRLLTSISTVKNPISFGSKYAGKTYNFKKNPSTTPNTRISEDWMLCFLISPKGW